MDLQAYAPQRLVSVVVMGIADSEPLQQAASELTADDLECLMAIARRRRLQNYLIGKQGARLEKRGLVAIFEDWASLTDKGRKVVDHTICNLG